MSSSPDEYCNPYITSAGNTTSEIIIGLSFTFLALLVIGGSTTKGDDNTLTGDLSSHMMEKEEDSNIQYAKVQPNGKESVVDPEKNHIFPISTATIMFQGLMILASVYYAMLMTNWGNPSVMDSDAGFFSNNYMSYWVQMSCLWISQILYVFSLTAPICFPDRDFGEA